MTYDSTQARYELLETIAAAAAHVGTSLGWLTLAYERLDDATAETLEEALFGPVQKAYGRARRTHDAFAERFALEAGAITPAEPHAGSRPVRELITHAADEAAHADALLDALQDSMRPIEVGETELRTGLTEVRTALDGLPQAARGIISRLGR